MPAVMPAMAPTRRAAPPDQSAEERRRELGDGGERKQADGGELRGAGRTVVDVGEEKDGEDRDAAHREELGPGIARRAGLRRRGA